MAETRRIGDRKVLLEGVLWVRHETVHQNRLCSVCFDILEPGAECYRPAATRGQAFTKRVGRRTRICPPCMAGKLAAASKEAACA
jgi:hypothetical protein